MKKLAYLASAVLTGLGFTSTASADISVGGTQQLVYSAADSITILKTFGTVDFGLSTTTASGMTISSGAGISVGDGISNASASTANAVVYGWTGLTFATGGSTIYVGTHANIADGVGEVDGVHASDVTLDHSGISSVTNSVDIANDEGTGIEFSTSMGGAALTLAYVVDTGADGSNGDRFDNATGTAMSAKITTTVGAVGVTAAYATHSDTSVDDTETGVALSYASGAGTAVVGYGSSTGTSDGNVLSASYTMALDADTSLAVGYASYDADSTTGTETNVSISRALGGGASVFADFASVSGTTTASTSPSSSATSAVAIGTKLSF